jgi:hypothetical protein
MTSGQLSAGALAGAFVVLVDYFAGFAAPSLIISSATLFFTAAFVYLWPFLKALQARVIGPAA